MEYVLVRAVVMMMDPIGVVIPALVLFIALRQLPRKWLWVGVGVGLWNSMAYAFLSGPAADGSYLALRAVAGFAGGCLWALAFGAILRLRARLRAS